MALDLKDTITVLTAIVIWRETNLGRFSENAERIRKLLVKHLAEYNLTEEEVIKMICDELEENHGNSSPENA